MALVNVNNNYYGVDADSINQKLDKMNEDLKLVQEQLAAAELKADTILTNLEGVQTDVTTLKQQIADLENDGATKLIEEMQKLKGKDFVIAFQSMTEFVKPKLARQEVKADIDTTITSKAPTVLLPDGTTLEI